MQSQFKSRHEGLRWQLQTPTLKGLEGKAAIAVQKTLQQFLPYVLPVVVSPEEVKTTGHTAVTGSIEQPVIRNLIESGVISAPEGPEGYSLYLGPAPWNGEARLLVVAGSDAAGTLYGSQEAAARLSLEGNLLDGFAARRHHLENGVSFALTERPVIRRRGLWSWGYAIYSFRKFIDHMVKLKLNTLVIWNDHAPLNAREVIDYAHASGVRVVLGFHCGWGHRDSLDISNAADRATIVQNVRQTYQAEYAHLPHDGVYFQTLTEHSEKTLSGAATSAWVCQLVNETAAALLDDFPHLRIEFGIHGTSIGADDRELERVDPRVQIVWEDCGSVPFAYFAHQTADYAGTLDWSQRLAVLRPETEFAMVAKGWMSLRWEHDFENHQHFIMGEQSSHWMQQRLVARQSEWDKTNHHWYQSYPLAASFYREILKLNPNMTVTGLVEDGMFEEKIQPSVALLAETLWNPYQTDAELLARATRPFYAH